MKAKVIETGEIIEVEHIGYSRALHDSMFCNKNNRQEYFGHELEIIDNNTPQKEINWEQRRFKLANSAMQGLLINPKFLEICDAGIQVAKKLGKEIEATDFYAEMAISYADAIISKLKEESV